MLVNVSLSIENVCNQQKGVNSEVRPFVKNFYRLQQTFTLTSFLKAVLDEKTSEIADVDILVSANLKDCSKSTPTIFQKHIH